MMKQIGRNRTVLGLGILACVLLSTIGAMWFAKPEYLAAVVGPAFLAFGHLISKDDDMRKEEADEGETENAA